VVAAAVCRPATFVVNARSSPVNNHRRSEHANENSDAHLPSVNALLNCAALEDDLAAR
jgi:hypothetical protein